MKAINWERLFEGTWRILVFIVAIGIIFVVLVVIAGRLEVVKRRGFDRFTLITRGKADEFKVLDIPTQGCLLL